MHVLDSAFTAELYEDTEWIYISTLRKQLSAHEPSSPGKSNVCERVLEGQFHYYSSPHLYFKFMLLFPFDIIILYRSLTSYTNNELQMLSHPDFMELTCPVSTSVPSGDVSVSVIHPLHFILTSATFLSADSTFTLYTQGHPFQISRLPPHSASSQMFSPPPCLTEM